MKHRYRFNTLNGHFHKIFSIILNFKFLFFSTSTYFLSQSFLISLKLVVTGKCQYRWMNVERNMKTHVLWIAVEEFRDLTCNLNELLCILMVFFLKFILCSLHTLQCIEAPSFVSSLNWNLNRYTFSISMS